MENKSLHQNRLVYLYRIYTLEGWDGEGTTGGIVHNIYYPNVMWRWAWLWDTIALKPEVD